MLECPVTEMQMVLAFCSAAIYYEESSVFRRWRLHREALSQNLKPPWVLT